MLTTELYVEIAFLRVTHILNVQVHIRESDVTNFCGRRSVQILRSTLSLIEGPQNFPSLRPMFALVHNFILRYGLLV